LHHALRYLLSALAHCGQRFIARGGAARQAFKEFSEVDAFDCLHQTTQLSKVIRKRWEAWSIFSEIHREILQR
jgi:hypothetical protein